MNREEILKAVQVEKQDTGEYEKMITRKAAMLALALGVMLCSVMSVVELWVFKKMDFGKYTILFAIIGFTNLYEGKKCKEKKKIISGLIEIIIAVICFSLYIGALFI